MQSTLSESKRELLGKLLRGKTAAASRRPGIPRRPAGTDAPMSYGQQQIWLHSQFSTKLPIYNEPVTIHRLGSLDRSALEKAFTEIVRRHEAWRTTFGWNGDELVQRIQPPPEHIDIPFLDVSRIPSKDRQGAALQIATADALAPFDLAVGPMYRPRLIRFSEDEHRLYLTLHHIIFDGVSLYRVFLPELQTLYEEFSAGATVSSLDPLPLQYADYAVWQRRWVEEIAPRQMAYWREKINGLSRRDVLKTDHPRQAAQSYRGAMLNLALDAATSSALKDLSRELDVTPFMTLLATFYMLIWSRSREEDLVIGVTSAGRGRSELEGMLGCFLNTVLLRTGVSGELTFAELVARCKDELFGALANDGLPFSLVVKELSGERDGSRHPLFQLLFSFEPPLAPLKPGWKFTRMDVETGSAKFDLHLELDEFPQGVEGRFIYNADLFDRSTIEQMGADWVGIVSEVVATPSRRISELVPSPRPQRQTLESRTEVAAAALPSQRSVGLLKSVRKLFSTR